MENVTEAFGKGIKVLNNETMTMQETIESAFSKPKQ